MNKRKKGRKNEIKEIKWRNETRMKERMDE